MEIMGMEINGSAPKGRQLRSAQDLKNAVAKLYGGRCAEKILFGDRGRITTGASNDIERATKIIRSFVVNYGLVDEYGLLNLEVAEAPRGKVLDKEIELAKEIEAAVDEMLGRTSTSSGQSRTSSLRTPHSTEKTRTESCRTRAPLRTARPPHRERGVARALLQM